MNGIVLHNGQLLNFNTVRFTLISKNEHDKFVLKLSFDASTNLYYTFEKEIHAKNFLKNILEYAYDMTLVNVENNIQSFIQEINTPINL